VRLCTIEMGGEGATENNTTVESGSSCFCLPTRAPSDDSGAPVPSLDANESFVALTGRGDLRRRQTTGCHTLTVETRKGCSQKSRYRSPMASATVMKLAATRYYGPDLHKSGHHPHHALRHQWHADERENNNKLRTTNSKQQTTSNEQK
jgi:hypothetical protein